MKAAKSHLPLYLVVGYTLLVLYASLTPFTGWRDPGYDVLDFLRPPLPRYVQAFDIIVNVLAYVPVGLLAALALGSSVHPVFVALFGTAVGAGLSLSMEVSQAYLPGRISSALDLITNVAGGALGARLFLPGGRTDLGIALVALWFFSQLDPSLPLLGVVFFSNGIQAQLAGLGADSTYRMLGPVSVCLTLMSLGMLLMLLMRSNRSALAALAVLVWVAALMKLGAASMLLRSEAAFLWVSNEIVWAIMLGAALVALAALLPRRRLMALCAISLIGTVLLTFVRPDEVQSFLSLRFFRFSDLQLIRYTSLSATVAAVWPYVALGYLIVLRFADRKHV
jgi:VanZ family protein